MRYCRLTPNEKLSDRFLFSGVLKDPASTIYLAYIIEITKPWFPTSRVAPIIINELKSNLSRLSGSSDLLVEFEETLKDVNEALFDLSEQGETEWIGNLNSLIILNKNQEIHLSQAGTLPGYLFRKQKINQITEGLSLERETHPLKSFSSIISGQVEENDRLLIANHELFNVLSLDMLRQIIVGNSPYQSSLLVRRSLKKHNVPTVSSIIFNFSPQNEEELEPDIVIIEEGFERWYKKLWRIFKPKAVDAWEKTKYTTNKARQTYKEKVSPRINAASKTGFEGVKKASQSAYQFSKDKVAPKVKSSVVKLIVKRTPEQEKAKIVELEQTHQIEKFNPFSHNFKKIVSNSGKKSLNIFKYLRFLQNRKVLYILAIIILISISFLYIRSNRQVETVTSTDVIKKNLDKAKAALVEMEKHKALANEEKTLEALIAAQTALDEIADQKNSDKKDLESQIKTELNFLTNTTQLDKPIQTLSFSDESINQIEQIAPYIFTSSDKNNKIYRQAPGSLNSSQEKEVIISPPPNRGFSDLFVEENNSLLSIMAITGDGQVYRIQQNGNDTKVTEQKNPLGKFAIGDSAEGFLGNLYLMDGSTGLLWKYPKSAESFGKGINQVDINTVDLKKAVSIAIDGSIYILKQDGKVVKLLKGLPETDFSLAALPQPNHKINKPLKIFTTKTDDHLFILDGGLRGDDPEPARILEFDKNGKFQKQFALPDNLTNVKDGLIKISEKKVWILNNDQVLEFNLP